jgi:hypothetical protein
MNVQPFFLISPFAWWNVPRLLAPTVPFLKQCRLQRPILNSAPRGKLWSLGAKFSPRSEFCPPGVSYPLGVNFSVRPSNLLNSGECSTLWVNKGVNIPPRGHSSPLGSSSPLGKLHPWGNPCCWKLASILLFEYFCLDKIDKPSKLKHLWSAQTHIHVCTVFVWRIRVQFSSSNCGQFSALKQQMKNLKFLPKRFHKFDSATRIVYMGHYLSCIASKTPALHRFLCFFCMS